MDKLKTIIESVPMKIIGSNSTFLGLILNCLRIFGITDDMSISVIGTIIFVIGFIFMCLCLFLQHIDICNLKKEKSSKYAENKNLKKEIEDLEKNIVVY